MKRLVSLIVIWGVVVGLNLTAYKYLLSDSTPQPPTTSAVGGKLAIALDTFSGYCIFRTPEFKKKLAEKKIDLELVDDKADYGKRIKTLADGTTPMAVFTLDALIAQTGGLNPQPDDPPATVVMLIDESRGADAIYASKTSSLTNINSLNNRDGKFVLLTDSPSETLTRVVRNQLKFSLLAADKKAYLVPKDKPSEVLEALLDAKPGNRTAFVLWEPYVSRAKAAGARQLIASNSFPGYIVDVLVVQRKFLREHPDDVKAVVEAYLELLHVYQQSPDGMAKLLVEDGVRVDEKFTIDEARQAVEGIWWKNTVENYAHLGIRQPQGLQSIDSMMDNITSILNATREPGDPAEIRVKGARKLVDKDVLQALLDKTNFQVGKEEIRNWPPPPPLPEVTPPADEDWEKWPRVTSPKVDDFEFSRGKPALPSAGEDALELVATEMKNHPDYYVFVEAHSVKGGDAAAANQTLGEIRAGNMKSYLQTHGVPADHIRPRWVPSGESNKGRIILLKRP
jgi:ABC-type nitrate/sulfonate/bicarbonate transport system substrate-binding protein/outer membrane protein OmpA-like peptidoglycan-associated protein